MIAHLREREKNLEPFGWSPEDAEWVAMVCLHSGVFTRSQFTAYFNAHPSRAYRFVKSLVELKLAVLEPIPVMRRGDRTRSLPDHPQGHLPGAGGSQHPAPEIFRSGGLSSAAPVARLRHRTPRARMAPDRRGKGLVLRRHRHPKGAPAKADLYRGNRGRHPLFQSEAPGCGRADLHVCLCRSGQRNLHRNATLGPGARASLG